MVGNWTQWAQVGFLQWERVRAKRSWFGFIREERERRTVPDWLYAILPVSLESLLNGEEQLVARRWYNDAIKALAQMKQELADVRVQRDSVVADAQVLAAAVKRLQHNAEADQRRIELMQKGVERQAYLLKQKDRIIDADLRRLRGVNQDRIEWRQKAAELAVEVTTLQEENARLRAAAAATVADKIAPKARRRARR